MHFDFHWRHIKAFNEACLRAAHHDRKESRVLFSTALEIEVEQRNKHIYKWWMFSVTHVDQKPTDCMTVVVWFFFKYKKLLLLCLMYTFIKCLNDWKVFDGLLLMALFLKNQITRLTAYITEWVNSTAIFNPL